MGILGSSGVVNGDFVWVGYFVWSGDDTQGPPQFNGPWESQFQNWENQLINYDNWGL